MSVDTKNIFLILILSFLSLSLFSIFVPVYQVSEAREGHVVKAMLEGGNLVSPFRLGSIIPSKPMLYHWICYAFARLFGGVNSYILRLPSILSSCFLLVLFYFFSKKLLSQSTSLICSLFLLSTYGFFNLGADGRVDMLFNLFVLSAIFMWLNSVFTCLDLKLGIDSILKRDYILVSLLISLSVLTKGPLGLVLPILLIILTSYSAFGFKSLFSLIKPVWLISIAAPIAWYYLAYEAYGFDVIRKQILFENFNRILGLDGISVKPWWFYLKHLFTQGFPWIFFIIIFGSNTWKEKSDESKKLRILKLTFISIIFLLSYSSGKRRGYLLTTLPFLILIVVYRLSRFNIKDKLSLKMWKCFSFVPVSIYSLVVIFLNFFSPGHWVLDSKSLLTLIEAKKLTYHYGSYFLILSLILSFVSIKFVNKYRESQTFNSFLLLLFTIVFHCYLVFLPFLERVKYETHSFEKLAYQLASVVPEDHILNVLKEDRDESLDVLLFYYKQAVKVVEPSKASELARGYYLISKTNYDIVKKKQKVLKILTKLKRQIDDDDESLFYLAKN